MIEKYVMKEEMMIIMKAYIASATENGIDNIDGTYYLITEEGEVFSNSLLFK